MYMHVRVCIYTCIVNMCVYACMNVWSVLVFVSMVMQCDVMSCYVMSCLVHVYMGGVVPAAPNQENVSFRSSRARISPRPMCRSKRCCCCSCCNGEIVSFI